jgi:hypothetical protein
MELLRAGVKTTKANVAAPLRVLFPLPRKSLSLIPNFLFA